MIGVDSSLVDVSTPQDATVNDAQVTQEAGVDAGLADTGAPDSNTGDANDASLADALDGSDGGGPDSAPFDDATDDIADAGHEASIPGGAAPPRTDRSTAGRRLCRDQRATAPPVFVLDARGMLYSFDLTNFTFGATLPVSCPTSVGSADSFGIDEWGNAYIEFSDYTVQILSLSACAGRWSSSASARSLSPLPFHFMQTSAARRPSTSRIKTRTPRRSTR